ncbi:MAG TPA: serine/threonine protein kinase [Promineifilum sp.]|nr:serine/threonine protein kinase [Promineifilum sp.]
MAQADELIGLQINNYVIRRYLARGGMADVYVAENIRLQREVVLKVLLPALLDNTALVERFRREALSMARLQHSNIVQVYDSGDLPDGRPFIVMQYIRGGTLETLLEELVKRGQVMTSAFALAIARQVAAALSVAHAAGIIHRDLKPSNILLDEQRRPLLTDLGIAFVQDTQRLTRTDTFIGTPHYMAPEQARGLPLDARSDIYSLGVVLFEMLAGRRPFPGDSHYALIHAHVSVPAPSLATVRPGLPRAVNQVVARCLEKEPDRRFQTATELAAALDGALGEEGAAGTLTSSGEWQWRPRQSGEVFVDRAGQVRPPTAETKRPTNRMLPLGIAALVVLLAGGFWLLARDPGPPPAPSPAATAVAGNNPAPAITAPAVAAVAATSPPAPTAAGAAAAPATTEPPPATETPAPTEPPTTAPATTAALAAPGSSGPLMARVVRSVFTRSGPGMTYTQSGSLAEGDVVEVLGRDPRGDWFVVRSRGGEVWVSAGYIEPVAGSLADVAPAATLPARPTATPPPRPTNTPAPQPPPSGGGGNPSPTEPPVVTELPEPTPTDEIPTPPAYP